MDVKILEKKSDVKNGAFFSVSLIIHSLETTADHKTVKFFYFELCQESEKTQKVFHQLDAQNCSKLAQLSLAVKALSSLFQFPLFIKIC